MHILDWTGLAGFVWCLVLSYSVSVHGASMSEYIFGIPFLPSWIMEV
jgi:hypothetical protein